MAVADGIKDLTNWSNTGNWNQFSVVYNDGYNSITFNTVDDSRYPRRYFRLPLSAYDDGYIKMKLRAPADCPLRDPAVLPRIYIFTEDPWNGRTAPTSLKSIASVEMPVTESANPTEIIIDVMPSTANIWVSIECKAFAPNSTIVYYIEGIECDIYEHWVVVNDELVNERQIEDASDPTKPPFANLLMRCDPYMEEGYPYNEAYIDIQQAEPIPTDVQYPAIRFLSRIRVKSRPHGLNKIFPVLKVSIPLDNPGGANYQLGESSVQSMTSHTAEINAKTLKQIEDLPSPSSILQAAKDNATELIKAADNGYVTLKRNAEGLIEEILICDRLNYFDPDAKIWRWNINGLGYSSTGYNGEFGTAMTMDGSIVADRITTGLMSADRIRGGNLVMGGYDNVAGSIIVRDPNGEPVCVFNNAGANIKGQIYADNGDGVFMNLTNGHLYGGHRENGEDVIDVNIHTDNLFDDNGTLKHGLGMIGDILGINFRQLWVGNDDMGLFKLIPQEYITVVTGISTDSEGKVTNVNTRQLPIVHGMIAQAE